MIEVSQEFIDENKNLVKHRQKFSQYTKAERKKRRDEVFKLHFDYGYSALTIADMMKINRNAINSDIKYLYSQVFKNSDSPTHDNWVDKQLYRFETQRAKLRKELDKELSFEQRMQVERLLYDIDTRLINLIIRMATSIRESNKTIVNTLNEQMKKDHRETRYVSRDSLYYVTPSQYERINKILREK